MAFPSPRRPIYIYSFLEPISNHNTSTTQFSVSYTIIQILMASSTIIVFDFDKTIIDIDSDNWVIDGLGSTQLFEQLLPTMPWNTLMDRMMKELHSQGKTVDDIAEVLKSAPLDPLVLSAIKTAYSLGCDLRVVSDANIFFIETILKHHGVYECFTEINTNPSYVDDEGKLRILPYHEFDAFSSSHGCSLCPPNMCKGKIIEKMQASNKGKRFIYLGDGKGDYCPMLRLSETDYAMPRKNYPVWELIISNPEKIKAEIHEWSNGEELKNVLLKIIDHIMTSQASTTQVLPLECKLDMMPLASSHDALPPALHVRP